MAYQFILTDYVNQMMEQAVYDKLEDGTFSGRIPSCKGVIAFGSTLRECEDELHSIPEQICNSRLQALLLMKKYFNVGVLPPTLSFSVHTNVTKY